MMNRRHFLSVTAAFGGTLIYSLDRKLSLLDAQTKIIQVPLHFFDEEEARIVHAAVSRIFPSDDLGPGATELGVVFYIDRQLASAYGRDRYRYTHEPFEETAIPELGYQGKASPRETYRDGLKGLQGFDQLSPDAQDEALRKIETTHFFSLLRQNTIEGMFCDPMHGGNKEMLGWQMLGFPGPQDSYAVDIDKHYGEAFSPKPVSLNGNDLVEEEN
jgi:gluconate 2-dehydrogenase gamma chain